VTISAHDLLHDAGLFRRAYPDWPLGGPAPGYASPAPARFQPMLAVYAGHPDDTRFVPLGASVDLDGLAAILRSGEGGRYLRVRLCVPGQPDAPLVLCCEAGGWTLLRDGAVVAEIKSSSEGASR
jgi:hypothetical protein